MIDRPAAPQRPPRRDWFAPAVVAGSLVLHAGLVAPLIWAPRAEAARPPAEIPIEVVQLPPEPAKPPEAAKPPETAKPPAPKPPAPRTPAPKPQARKAPEKARAAEPAKVPEKPPEKSVAQRMEQLIGPMPAMVMPALTSGDNPLDDTISYRQLILSRVARQKREDRHNGIPSHAVVAFTIGDKGEVVTCDVREKSLDPQLDAEAVAMVYRGAPYPPPPSGAPRGFAFGLAFHTS